MINNKTDLPSREILDILSYKTSLETSIKQLSLRKVDIDIIIKDIMDYSHFVRSKDEFLFLKNKRLKSIQSAFIKYKKNIKGQGCKVSQCFNDILGIRICLEDYPDIFPDYLRVVDIRKGKKTDDGYRAIHLYYQKDGYHYPIEIQLWCGKDLDFNIWSHTSTYKYLNPEVGLELRTLYDEKKINTQKEFEEMITMIMGRG